MTERRDRIRVHIEGKEYNVVGSDFQQMLSAVKKVTGRRFVGELKIWQLPGTAADIQAHLELHNCYLEGGTPVADEVKTHANRYGSDRIRVTVEGRQLAVVGGSFQDMLAVVKGLPNRRFDPESKTWEIPGALATVKHLIESANFQLEGADQDLADSTVPTMEQPRFSSIPDESLAYEEPVFAGDDEVPPYETPNWWDDESIPPPPAAPPLWEEEIDGFGMSEPPRMFDGMPADEDLPDHFQPKSSFAPSNKPSKSRHGADQIRIRVGGIPFVVTGGEFQAMLSVIKTLPGRRFDPEDKVWDIPAEVTIDDVKQQMAAAGFEISRG
jgi:hypothetical protein